MHFDELRKRDLFSFTAADRARTLSLPVPIDRLIPLVEDTATAPSLRDRAMWTLTYQEQPGIGGLLQELSEQDRSPKVRKSAAWSLLKLGQIDALRQSLDREHDANVRAWKAHLLADATDRLFETDLRPLRILEGRQFDVTVPLQVEGLVEFRTDDGQWQTVVAGPIMNERMIGDLTPGIRAETFQTELVLQKRIRNIHGSARDHFEGYLLRGLSRQIAPNVMRHQYEGRSLHTVYPSGVVEDASMGQIDGVTATLERVADTTFSQRPGVPRPIPEAVRGSFKGYVFASPRLLSEPGRPVDGLLQIISPMDANGGGLVNGIFHGTFRGVLEDVDGDGVVEANGVEMFVGTDGRLTG